MPNNKDFMDIMVDDILNETQEMDVDINEWLKRHAPQWHKLGRDEMWIRMRVEIIQAARALNKIMAAKGFTEAQRREMLRLTLIDITPERQQQIQIDMHEHAKHQVEDAHKKLQRFIEQCPPEMRQQLQAGMQRYIKMQTETPQEKEERINDELTTDVAEIALEMFPEIPEAWLAQSLNIGIQNGLKIDPEQISDDNWDVLYTHTAEKYKKLGGIIIKDDDFDFETKKRKV